MQKGKKLLILIHYIRLDEDLLICDFAETYGIINYRTLDPFSAGTLAYGLHPDSRVRMKDAGADATFEQTLAMRAVDELAMIRWLNSADGVKGVNRPKMISQTLQKAEEQGGYDSPEEFMRAYYGE